MSQYINEDANFVEIVANSLYYDDFVGSLNTENECLVLYRKLKAQFAAVPRLQLLAALILARFMNSVKQALSKKIQIRECVTLWWIRSISKTLKPFVQNRVVEIREFSAPSQWCYCPSKQYPADILSRGAKVSTLKVDSFWCRGLDFLVMPPDFWPTTEHNTTS